VVKGNERMKSELVRSKTIGIQPVVDRLFKEISNLIEEVRERTASAV
jgi:hypothetical protein